MEWLSRILAATYLATPPLAAVWAGCRARRGGGMKAINPFLLSCVSGATIGSLLCVVYASIIGGRAPIGQMALAALTVSGVLLLLKGVNWLLKQGAERLFRVRVPVSQRGGGWVARATAATTLRVVLLFLLGLPYVMAVAMVYRPKVVAAGDPRRQLGFDFKPVRFTAADGVPLAGWWIPAKWSGPEGETRPPGWGERTVIFCHGLGANKANQLTLVRDLPPSGYNVLAFDFRAHGESGGQVTTFGDLERRDVLGAVRWARAVQPEQARHIYGLGISMGGAAVIAAAADPTPEGRALEAVAVYDTYDDLGRLAESIAHDRLPPPLAWMVLHVAEPIASAHAGADLPDFAPVDLADRLAPRPLLVIHGRGDEIIPFAHGVRLFDRASQPKLRLWLGADDNHGHFFDRQGNQADHNGVIQNHDAAKAVRLFFEAPQSVL